MKFDEKYNEIMTEADLFMKNPQQEKAIKDFLSNISIGDKFKDEYGENKFSGFMIANGNFNKRALNKELNSVCDYTKKDGSDLLCVFKDNVFNWQSFNDYIQVSLLKDKDKFMKNNY